MEFETETKDAQSFDLVIELEDEDPQAEVMAACGCKLERTESTVGFIYCDLHRKVRAPEEEINLVMSHKEGRCVDP